MKKSPGQKIIGPSGALGIESAASLADELRAAFAEGSEVVFDLSKVEDIELPILQLLYAARRFADAKGGSFHLSGKIADRLSRRLAQAGFIASACSSGSELESGLLDYRKESA